MPKQPSADTPSEKNSSSGVIYTALLDMLRSGDFKPGDKLPNERELAQQFRTGRAMLRDALLMAQRDGLVTRKIGSGTYLSDKAHQIVETQDAQVSFSPDAPASFHAVLEARLVMEPGAAALAAEHHTDADKKHMRAMLAAIRTADTWLEFKESLYGAFTAVYRASGNKILAGVFEGMVQSRRAVNYDGRRLNSQVSDLVRRQAHDEIAVIIDAVLARDTEKARSEAYDYLMRMQTAVTI